MTWRTVVTAKDCKVSCTSGMPAAAKLLSGESDTAGFSNTVLAEASASFCKEAHDEVSGPLGCKVGHASRTAWRAWFFASRRPDVRKASGAATSSGARQSSRLGIPAVTAGITQLSRATGFKEALLYRGGRHKT